MTERTEFPLGDAEVDIIANSDGSLRIETSAEYGDSYVGWGTAHKTVFMDREKVREFRDFLNRALEWPTSTFANQ